MKPFLGLAPQATSRRPFGTLKGCRASGFGREETFSGRSARIPAGSASGVPGRCLAPAGSQEDPESRGPQGCRRSRRSDPC